MGWCLGTMFMGVCWASAQTVSTVREAEFRSRWTDYRVDDVKLREPETDDAPKNYLAEFTQFGPLEFHGGLTSGYEYSNEIYQFEEGQTPSKSSFFLAPSLIAIYEKEIGSWSIGARYSVGWLYYLDPDYRGSDGGISTSQTASLILLRMNDRLTVRSATTASSGTGFDIERGQETDRITAAQTFSVEYQLAEYIRTGVSGSAGVDSYETLGNLQGNNESSNYRYNGAIFLDNFWTEKTALRFELSAGSDTQESGNGITSNERTYAQGIFRVNYGPTTKLAFTGSVGLGVRDETLQNVGNDSQNGLRTVYSLSSTYTPSEKTSARAYIGIEGATSQPEFTLAINWHPREFTFLEISVYQQTGLSNIISDNERLSQGFLISLRQQFFRRLETSVSGGYEQTESLNDNQPAFEEDPYSFAGIGLGWRFNPYLFLQTQLRSSSGRRSFGNNSSGRQTRASVSLGLTF